MNNSISHSEIISGNVDFILSHFQEPMFPRKIMTKRLGHQKEVFSKQEALKYFESSDYKDCRINAYPSFTNYQGITRVAPSFVMIDLDLRDFGNSRDNLDRGQNKILKRINALTRGYSTVLWTGNGYHIYQPMEGFILEEEERFARLRELDGKDLTSKFIHFAEEYLTNKKEDPQHNPTVNSCLVRVPGTINSKCAQEVKIIQRWDGQKPPINYLLRYFRVWLINEKMQRKLIDSKRAQTQTANPTIIPWIEKLLQIPLDDHRKFVVWRIQSPYLINIRKYSVEEASNLIKNWLDKCNQLKSLDFNPNYMIKYNINSAKRNGYLPISLEKLRIENTYLYNMLAKSKVNNKLTYS
jgi:Primase X